MGINSTSINISWRPCRVPFSVIQKQPASHSLSLVLRLPQTTKTYSSDGWVCIGMMVSCGTGSAKTTQLVPGNAVKFVYS